ncbi:MAG: phosphoglycerate mutase family protein [Acidimicrobiales bacterium]
MGKLYIVRHAHAGARGPDDDADRQRPLSERGRDQAEGLRRQFETAGITRLVSSPFRRCVETLAPLASFAGVEVESDSRLAEAQGAEGAVALASELRDTTAALCSHGDVIPDLLDELVRSGVRFTDELRWPKSSTWVLTRTNGGFSKAVYVPPPA